MSLRPFGNPDRFKFCAGVTADSDLAAGDTTVGSTPCMHAMPECGGRFSILRRISGISRDEGNSSPDQGSAVIRRISTLGRPKLLSKHKSLPVARKSFRHHGRCTLLGAAATLRSTMTWSSTSRPAVNSPTITPSQKTTVPRCRTRTFASRGQGHFRKAVQRTHVRAHWQP
jgi:hypothetical protein